MFAANWARTGFHALQPATANAVVPANALSVAANPVAMNATVYVKPEVETLPESAARPEVLSEMMATSAIPSDNGNTALDAGSRSTTLMSPDDFDRRAAAVDRRLVEDAGGGGYKYKDNIKRRFCSESDSRTYSSSSDCVDCSSPSSSPAAVRHADENCSTAPTGSGRPTAVVASAADRSPGFVLHPSGAYYVPVIAATAQVRAVLGAAAHASSLEGQPGAAVTCHPVSIPVRFTGGAATAEVVSINDAASTKAHHPVQLQSLLQLQHL